MRTILRTLQRAANRMGYVVHPYTEPLGAAAGVPELRSEFADLPFAAQAMQKLLDDHDFGTVLDIGCGEGRHTRAFLTHGKRVTAVDYGRSIYFEQKPDDLEVVIGDFNSMEFDTRFDCIWASHVLEHQLDPHGFLQRCHELLAEDGTLAVTVPPRKDEIVGGHVTLWNAGLLLYRLVLAGFDCRAAEILSAGADVSVLVAKSTIELPQLAYDNGDVDRLAQFLPPGCGEAFNGVIARLNW